MPPESGLPALSDAALRLLREDQPSSGEISRAYRRFARPARRRPNRLLVLRWVIAGLAMGLGVAFGSEAIVQRLQPSSSQPGEARVVAAKVRKVAPVSAPHPRQQSDPEAAAPKPPAIARFEPVPLPASTVSAKPPRLEVDSHIPADRTAWAKAAEGLQNDHLSETPSALATPEHAGSDADREAALLNQAQIMLHQGDASSARALLLDLARHAQSAAVRNKARSLLAAPSNSALNVAPSGT